MPPRRVSQSVSVVPVTHTAGSQYCVGTVSVMMIAPSRLCNLHTQKKQSEASPACTHSSTSASPSLRPSAFLSFCAGPASLHLLYAGLSSIISNKPGSASLHLLHSKINGSRSRPIKMSLPYSHLQVCLRHSILCDVTLIAGCNGCSRV